MTEVVQINAHTWRIEDGFVRFFLLEGKEKALLLDTGANTPDALSIASKLTELPTILMNTHADPDHISGNASFEKVYMHPSEEDNYRAHGGKCEIIPVADGEEINLGERIIKIIATPGHTPGSICIIDKDARVLYSGDTVSDSDIYMFGERRNIHNFIESLSKLDSMKNAFEEIYPCHGTTILKNTAPASIKAAAESIVAGKATSVPIEMFGRPVALYKFDCCGFFCDR